MQHKNLTMIKTILAVLLLSFAQSVNATAPEWETDTLKVSIPAPITSLVVNDDVTVVLTNDETRAVTVLATREEQIPVKMELNAGTLTISRKKYSLAEKAVVYVPASFLRSVNMNGTGHLLSYNVIKLSKLTVHLSGECRISLRTNGKVNIIGWDGYEFKDGKPDTK